MSYSIYPCLYHLQQWEWAHWKTYHIAFIPAFIIYNNENEHIENTYHIASTPPFIIYNENEHIEKYII